MSLFDCAVFLFSDGLTTKYKSTKIYFYVIFINKYFET